MRLFHQLQKIHKTKLQPEEEELVLDNKAAV